MNLMRSAVTRGTEGSEMSPKAGSDSKSQTARCEDSCATGGVAKDAGVMNNSSRKPGSLRKLFARADRVVLATLAVFAVLAAFVPVQAVDSLWFTLRSLWGIAGFLLVSLLFAAYARASAAD